MTDQDDEQEDKDQDQNQEGRDRVEDGGGEVPPEVPEGEECCGGEGEEDHEVQDPLHDNDGGGVTDGEPGERETVDPDRFPAYLAGGDGTREEREEQGERESRERHGVAEAPAEDPEPHHPAEV